MIVLALPRATAKTLSSPSSSIISVHFVPSSSLRKVIKVKNVALLFQPEEGIMWELRFSFGFRASQAHLGVGGLTLCGTFVTHASNQAKSSDFPPPGSRSHKTHSEEEHKLSAGLLSLAVRDCRSRFSGTAALLPSRATTGQDQGSIQALSRTKPAADTHNSWDKSLPPALLGPTPSWVWGSSLKPVLALFTNFRILF